MINLGNEIQLVLMLLAIVCGEIVEKDEEGLTTVNSRAEEHYLALVENVDKISSVSALILSVCDYGIFLYINLEVGFDIDLFGAPGGVRGARVLSLAVNERGVVSACTNAEGAHI